MTDVKYVIPMLIFGAFVLVLSTYGIIPKGGEIAIKFKKSQAKGAKPDFLHFMI